MKIFKVNLQFIITEIMFLYLSPSRQQRSQNIVTELVEPDSDVWAVPVFLSKINCYPVYRCACASLLHSATSVWTAECRAVQFHRFSV